MENELKVIETDEDYQIASNFIQYNDLFIGQGYCESERYEKAEKALMGNEGILSEDQAMNLLSDISILGKTQWSAAYNMNTLQLSLLINRKYEDIYKFSLLKD